jgi:hypothetical protein
MRIFFISLLFSLSAFAQVRPDGFCDENTITNPAGDLVYDCDTLTIGAGTHVIPAAAAPGQYLDIQVAGDVTIADGAVIVLKGDDGVSDATEAQPGGVGGAGASDGGGNLAGPTDASDPPNGGGQGGSTADCGGGGGGGGFNGNAPLASTCVDGASTGAAGTAGLDYDLSVLFRGGFGGAAGGLGEFAAPFQTGTGGGGGGAIWLRAGGNITINGDINVRGGNGGPGLSDSGGGGGGSGGAIRIQATGQLINNGTFFLAGGTGGPGNGSGARGGNGASGEYELSDVDNIIEGVGTGAVGISGGSGESFRSSISCGTVKMKNNDLIFQMMMGFALVMMASRIRGRFRRSV